MADYSTIKPKKIILEMPFASLVDAVEGRLRKMNLPEQPFATLLTFWGGTQQGFWAFSLNPSDYVTKITCPTLVQWGANDARVSRHEVDEIINNLESPDKRLTVYETAGHESLYKKETIKWMINVTAFLSQ